MTRLRRDGTASNTDSSRARASRDAAATVTVSVVKGKTRRPRPVDCTSRAALSTTAWTISSGSRVRVCTSSPTVRSNVLPIFASSCWSLRMPSVGTNDGCLLSTQPMASWLGVMPQRVARPCRPATSLSFASRFAPLKRGMWARPSPAASGLAAAHFYRARAGASFGTAGDAAAGDGVPIYQQLSIEKFSPDSLKESDLPSDKGATLVFYCGSEQCTACHDGALAAIKFGYKNVFIMPAGIKGWEDAKKELEVS